MVLFWSLSLILTSQYLLLASSLKKTVAFRRKSMQISVLEIGNDPRRVNVLHFQKLSQKRRDSFVFDAKIIGAAHLVWLSLINFESVCCQFQFLELLYDGFRVQIATVPSGRVRTRLRLNLA